MALFLVGRRFLLQLPVWATVARPTLGRAQDFQQVAASVQRLYAALLAAMKAGAATPFVQRYDMLANPVTQALDLPTILQVAVGPTWSSVPPPQQSMLQTAFQKYTIATYAAQFDSYAGQRFEVLPGLRAMPNGDQVLHTQIIGGDGTRHVIDYVMRRGGAAWRAVDVLLDGSISRVAVLRSDFRRLVMRGGPTELANYLQRKATDLSGMTSPP